MPSLKLPEFYFPGMHVSFPSIGAPPWIFDPRRERDPDPELELIEPGSGRPLDASVLLTYFTNTSDEQPAPLESGECDTYQVDCNPFR